MRRLLLAIILAVVILGAGLPAQTASAVTEDWVTFTVGTDEVVMYQTIDTNSLQVDSFTCINRTTEPGVLWLEQDGVEFYRLRCAGGETVTKPITGFKWRRVPATDHDDPNSIRMPQGVVMRCGWPAP